MSIYFYKDVKFELSVLDQQVAVTHCKVVTSGRGLMLDGLVTM